MLQHLKGGISSRRHNDCTNIARIIFMERFHQENLEMAAIKKSRDDCPGINKNFAKI